MTAEKGLRDLERTLAHALDAELGSKGEGGGSAKPSEQASGPAPKAMPSTAAPNKGPAAPAPEGAASSKRTDAPVPAPEKVASGRALELQRKKAAASEMRDKLKQGADLLGSLLGANDAFISYLAKTEQELAQLERTERHAKETQALTEDMLREQKKLTAKYKEQVKQIELLEATKSRYRTAIENARGEIDRLKQLVKELRHDGETKSVSITILEDAKSQLTEANQGLQSDNRKKSEALKAQSQRIEELESEMASLKISLGEAGRARDSLRAEKDKALVELNDMTVRFEGVSAKHADLKALLEEKTFEMDAKSKAHEEAICSRDARIKELEAELIAAKKASEKDTGSDEGDPLVRLGLASLAAKAAGQPARDKPRPQNAPAKTEAA